MALSAEILAIGRPGENLAGLFIDNLLVTIASDRGDRPDWTGSLFAGRLGKFDRTMGGYFVELGTNRPGFVSRSKLQVPGGKQLTEGQLLTFQVIANPREGKGMRLSSRNMAAPAVTKAGLVLDRRSPVQRLQALAPYDAPFAVRFDRPETRRALGFGRDGQLTAPSDNRIAELRQAWRDAVSPTVAFPSGQLCFELTRAGWMVDVDLVANSDQVAANARALEALAEHLVLRNLSGLIVIDLVGLNSKTERSAVLARFDEALACWKDAAQLPPLDRSTIDGFGSLRLTRARQGRSATEQQMGRAEEPETGWRLSLQTEAIDSADQAFVAATAQPGRALVQVELPTDAKLADAFRKFFSDRNVKVEWAKP